jgi:hypothetical protein
LMNSITNTMYGNDWGIHSSCNAALSLDIWGFIGCYLIGRNNLCNYQ